MHFKNFYFLMFLLAAVPFTAQASTQETTATRINDRPRIDGDPNDAVWQTLEPSFQGNFTQLSPDNLEPSAYTTTIKLAYDDNSLYILARLHDPNPESIRRELGFRDGFGLNTDEFGIILDTYNQGQNGYFLAVTAAGVQLDTYITPNNEDVSWDAVWNSAVSFDDEGWIVEMEIPYYAVRFPKLPEQVWGLNFLRRVRSKNEEATWNPVDRSVSGIINQSGVLRGLFDIDPPLRLQFFPYVSTLVGRTGENGATDVNVGGGMDLKWGINESFTLDMALIPDFSQVRSDNQVLNLSPYEVQFSENRPFFTEGVDLFGKGGLLYSRRIGQVRNSLNREEPTGDEVTLLSSPSAAKLINAVKLSGRNKQGTGVGILNAITNATYNEYEVKRGDSISIEQVPLDPVTNFNVLVFDQQLKNNSNVGLINSNVRRWDGGRDANVTGLDFRINDKSNTYRVWGFGAYSKIWKTVNEEGQRDTYDGHKYFLAAGKVSGTWQYNVFHNVESDRYDINDLGFLRAPNEVTWGYELGYNQYTPFWIFNNFRSWTWGNVQQMYAPREYSSFNAGWNMNMQFKNFWYFGIGHNIQPMDNHDYFEPRQEGFRFTRLPSSNTWMYVESDRRKQVSFEMNPWMFRRKAWDSFDWGIWFSTRYRVNNQLSIRPAISYSDVTNERGFANKWDVNGDENWDANNDILVIGNRDIMTFEPSLQLDFIFNARMGLNMRLRHYWSRVQYTGDFFALDEDGSMEPLAYDGLHDRNYNAFNIDLFYNWQVAPGSFLTVAYKDAAQNYIDDRRADFAMNENFQEFWKSPHNQTLSLRLTYFVDYQELKNIF